MLTVGSIFAVLAKIVAIEQRLRYAACLGIEREGPIRHTCHRLQHDRIMRGIVSRLAPDERRMTSDETRRRGQRVEVASITRVTKARHDGQAGFMYVTAADSLIR